MRIVSLLPSATEIVYALGLGEDLVGVSHECDYPPGARTKPVISSSEIAPGLQSVEINSVVTAHQHGSHSLYRIDGDLLRRVSPDIILTQELCSVCAVPVSQVREAARILAGPCRVVSLEPQTLQQILDNILVVGEMTGREKEARRLVDQFAERIAWVASVAYTSANRPRVFCMEWMDPVMAGGHWIPEMICFAGGADALGQEGQPSTAIEWERVVAYAPEVMIIMPCGYKINRSLAEIDRLALRPGWYELPAVQSGNIYITDSPAYFSRPGPRIINGLEILAGIIHPELFTGLFPPASVLRLNWDAGEPIELQRMSERFSPVH